LSRDRDPFDRTLDTLRRRLTEHGPLQGDPLPVNSLAAELGVSPTPVREALARLAGEGLVARTGAGYAGVVHDALSLAELYGLAGILVLQLARGAPDGAVATASPSEAIVAMAQGADNRILALEVLRTVSQLAPFALAERAVLTPERWPIDSSQLGAFFRRYYARRVRRSEAILTAAMTAKMRNRI
jgi:DNA-binding GntR family transcriptional regulator